MTRKFSALSEVQKKAFSILEMLYDLKKSHGRFCDTQTVEIVGHYFTINQAIILHETALEIPTLGPIERD